ncbi:hypothetical protein ACFV2Z_40260 [Streptomyces sp. NPDC059688]|uniref:Uncharacterized protein n=1 Tax=Streptomyces albidocamelliae TaxID=2981135 RepID=A0ABY6F206_9ACTN|nr:hypothetical protein [Streptomyces sp. HUAS 14-6]UXY40496.1 hypothetical protein N8I86_38700 [Streptomyces sp. HUAS 14-6]
MTVNDLLALLVVITALRVFLPDLQTGMRRLLRAGARVGVAELLHTQSPRADASDAPVAVASRDAEA